jgi:hypothetical protein
MGAIKSKTKYTILYGPSGSGKTLLQYALQSSLNVLKEIKPTEGYNYEEISLNNINLGIFDVSGNQNQYEIVSIVTKCVNISAIIYVVPMNILGELDKSAIQLELLLGNNNLKDGLSLIVIYNKDIREKDKTFWMPVNLLDSRMKLEKLKKKYKLQDVKSCIIDVSMCNDNDTAEFYKCIESMVEGLENQN